MTTAFWISPKGQIFDVDYRHIEDIFSEPERYGFTRKELEKTYKKHKEPLGLEGNAREEIMLNLIRRGWIRVRKIRNSWSIQLFSLRKFKGADNVWDWVRYALTKKIVGKNSEINVQELGEHGDVISSSANEILSGKGIYESVWKRKFKKFVRAEIKNIING
jgi:hypothetical protein